MKTYLRLSVLIVMCIGGLVHADVFNMEQGLVSLDFVVVGDAGNEGDWSNSTGYGAVGYVYAIGKYEVTAGQYTVFLNATAKSDPYGLYHTDMWMHEYGCKIDRSGRPGDYSYTVANDRANRPVNFVSFYDAARFVNWLNTGTTESGAYLLNGLMDDEVMVSRSQDAMYWIPTEDEWYKAAYYDPQKPGGPGWWDYPTRSDEVPSNQLNDSENGANFNDDGRLTIGKPYYATDVGAFVDSASPWGTYDQGGNVSEWNETVIDDRFRGSRGGKFTNNEVGLSSHTRSWKYPGQGNTAAQGFRVASVVIHAPEPSGFVLAMCGMIILLLVKPPAGRIVPRSPMI